MYNPVPVGPSRTYQEQVANQLTDKPFHVVELGAAEDAVQLFSAGAAVPIGVVCEVPKSEPDSPAVAVIAIASGEQVKVKQSAAINKGAPVKAVNGGTVETAGAATRSIGRKVSQGAGAAGDIIVIELLPENIP